MMQAVLLHTIQDAEHYLKQDLFSDAILFSANIHVVFYLRYQCSRECNDLCSYLNPQDIQQLHADSIKVSHVLLNELDQQVAPELNSRLDLTISYFEPLYSFIAARQLSIYMLLDRCLRNMLEQVAVDVVINYAGAIGPLATSIEVFFSRMFPSVCYKSITYTASTAMRQTTISEVSLQQLPALVLQNNDDQAEFQEEITKQHGKVNQSILLFEPLQQMERLEELHEATVYMFPFSSSVTKSEFHYEASQKILPQTDRLKTIQSSQGSMKDMLKLLYEAIKKDFCYNIVQYLQVLNQYRNLHESSPINKAYWETPPIQGAGALLLAYLLANQTTQVTGIQSRATFFVGQTVAPYAPVSVFNRCHRFAAQNASDSVELYRKHLQGTTIVELNAAITGTKPPRILKRRKPVEVAIYLKPTTSFMQTGQISSYAHKSKVLLDFLGETHNKEIHVVTHQNPLASNCALLPSLKTLNNITLIKNARLDNYLLKYAPKLILLDSPMPLLKEILEEEIPVILIKDPTVLLTGAALDALTKRVHYADGVEEVKLLLRMFFGGTLLKRSDTGYVNKYCT